MEKGRTINISCFKISLLTPKKLKTCCSAWVCDCSVVQEMHTPAISPSTFLFCWTGWVRIYVFLIFHMVFPKFNITESMKFYMIYEVKSYLADSSVDWENVFVVRHNWKAILFVSKQALPKHQRWMKKLLLQKVTQVNLLVVFFSHLLWELNVWVVLLKALLPWFEVRVRVLEFKLQQKWKFQLPWFSGVQVERHTEGNLISFFHKFKKEHQIDH